MVRFFFLFFLFPFTFEVSAQLVVNSNVSPSQLIGNELISKNSGITIISSTAFGNPQQFGTFKTSATHIDIREGVIISTGYAKDAEGPNDRSNVGTRLVGKGDEELTHLAKNQTFDAAILQFDFIPKSDQISFEYVFASEEYPEYVNKGVNDVFAFILIHVATGKRTNLAILPGTNSPVTIDEVNHLKHSDYYIANGKWDENSLQKWKDNLELGEYAYNFQFDGLTTWLKAQSSVIPGEAYVLKIGIADAGDGAYDSAVLLKKNSLVSKPSKPIEFNVELDEFVKYFDSSHVSVRGDSLILTLNLHFENNKSVLYEKEDFAYFDEIGKVLNQNLELNLVVEGYTDGIGNSDYNLKLSQERANYSMNELLSRGIDSKRMRAEGFGMNRPVASNQVEEGRMKNRRVEFVFFINRSTSTSE